MSVHEHKEKGKKSIRLLRHYRQAIPATKARIPAAKRSRNSSRTKRTKRQAIASLKMNPQKSKSYSTRLWAGAMSMLVIVNGGTGIAPRDGTYEVVSRFLEKKLDGFGEIFRYLSYLDIGSAAIMSRAAAERRVVKCSFPCRARAAQ